MCRRPTAERAWVVVLVLAGCAAEVRQPVAYNHSLHVKKLEIGCDTCHETSRSGEVAGLPSIATCATCHQEPNGNSAEERKVVAAVHDGREISWARLYDLPRHVYFTHRRHVAVARIACEQCHGPMGAQARPPSTPLVTVTMERCLACHRARGAPQDCDVCHR